MVRKSEAVYRLLTLRDAAREYGLHTKAIYAAVERGQLHPVQPGNRTLYPEWELEALARSLSSTYVTYVA